MTAETADEAWARIDAALARIEGAGRDGLAARHVALRARVEDAIAALDQLIAEADD